jgi:hypothetical protein
MSGYDEETADEKAGVPVSELGSNEPFWGGSDLAAKRSRSWLG